MATLKYGPIEVDDEWNDCYKKVTYSIEYITTSDTLYIVRIIDGKQEDFLRLNQTAANAIGKLLTQWLYDYEDEKEWLKAVGGKEDE